MKLIKIYPRRDLQSSDLKNDWNAKNSIKWEVRNNILRTQQHGWTLRT